MNIELVTSQAVEVLKNFPYKPFLCLPMSAVLYAMLKDNHGLKPKLITGNLLFDNKYIFKQDFSIKEVKSDSFRQWSGHAWVELEGYICDLSFFRTLYSNKFVKPFKTELIKMFGTGKGSLMARKEDMNNFSLRYEKIDELEDHLATGIIKGLKHFL